MMCRAVQACSYGANHILLMANIDLDRRIYGGNCFLYGDEKTASGFVRAALILRVKEPMGRRKRRVQLRYHV